MSNTNWVQIYIQYICNSVYITTRSLEIERWWGDREEVGDREKRRYVWNSQINKYKNRDDRVSTFSRHSISRDIEINTFFKFTKDWEIYNWNKLETRYSICLFSMDQYFIKKIHSQIRFSRGSWFPHYQLMQGDALSLILVSH